MSPEVSLLSVMRAEWLKFRSVRSTVLGVGITFFLTLGLGALVTTLIRVHWSTTPQLTKLTFDPVQTSLVGAIFAQFAIGVIGSLFITTEYTSGSMRTTLMAVPRRFELAVGKLIVLLVSMFIVSEVACFAAFLMGQAIFSGVVPTASLSSGAVLRTVILSGVYLTLLSALAYSLGLILRQSAACISAFVSLLLVLPLIVVFLPQSWQNDIRRFLPGEAGHAMTTTMPVPHDFSAWGAFIMLAIYVVVVFGIGATMFARRDA
jgi:ABC-2 type transport system permease protein